MTNERVKLTPEDVLSLFDDSENFTYLTHDIQNKIVRFFTDQPITAVDACQIVEFLEFGNNFTVYYGYKEFLSNLDLSSTKAILACKANFDSFGDTVAWFESFSPKLVKTIPPSEERIEAYRQKHGAADLFTMMETEHIYEHDVYVAPMFNTMGYQDIEFYAVSSYLTF